MEKTLTIDEIKRILLANQLIGEQVAPSMMTLPTQSSSISGTIPNGTLPFGTIKEFDENVLYPSIQNSFDNSSDFEDFSNNGLIRLEKGYKDILDKGGGLPYNQVEEPRSLKDIINPKRKA